MESSDSEHALRHELAELTERIERVERRLGIIHHRFKPALPKEPPAVAETPVDEARREPEPLMPVVPTFVPEHATATADGIHAAMVEEALPEVVEESGRSQARSLEGLVGGRYFLAAGAIVVVIGVGLFLKLGYDQGWFRMANTWKCVWGALFGFALIAGGEVARRRINVLAGSGLSAAGLGALYLSTYAAHGFYSLIGPTPAFLFLAVVTLLGIAIAVVSRQAGVALLAMLGGYLAPFLLNVDHPSVYVVPLHALSLLAVGLVLSGWKPETFRVLRTVGWWGTVVLGTIWMIFQGVEHALVALPFLITFWGAVHAELIISVRGQAEPESLGADEPPRASLLRWSSARPVVTSISTSFWTVFFGIVALRAEPILPDWFAPAGAMVAAALLAMVLAGHLRVLRDSPRTDAQRLGAGLAMQAGALLIIAVALAFSGSIEVIAWLAVGIAAVGAGAWIGAPSLAVYGLVPLTIAVSRLVTYDALVTRRTFTPVSLANLALDHWTVLMMLAAGAWISAALLILRIRETFEPLEASPRVSRRFFLDFGPRICTGVGLALLLASVLHPEGSIGAVSVTWLVIGVGVTAWQLFERRLPLQSFATVIIALATAAWYLAYLEPGWQTITDGIIHPGMLVGGLVVLVTGALAAWYKQPRGFIPIPQLWILYAVWSVAMVWAVSSLEIHRLVGRGESPATPPFGALSLWWGLFSAGIIALGFHRRVDAIRIAGCVLLGAAILAWAASFPIRGWTHTSHGGVIHPGFVIALIIIAAVATVARRWRTALSFESIESRVELRALIGVAVSMLWVATSLEVFRLAANFRAGGEAQHGALSVWWGVFAVALLAAGFRWKAAPIRYVGLALLGVATIKALIIDLADVSAGWRVVSVLGLGLLMLAVALVYVRTSARLLRPDHHDGTAVP